MLFSFLNTLKSYISIYNTGRQPGVSPNFWISVRLMCKVPDPPRLRLWWICQKQNFRTAGVCKQTQMARCDPLPILNTPQGLWDHSMNFRMTTLEFYLNPILGLVP